MARSSPTRRRWYFSLRSPYSWFAYRDLVDRYADVADQIEWIPFWEPDEWTDRLLTEAGIQLPIVEMSRAKNFYILQDTRRLARARGLTMSWPIDREPCWEVAHLGYLAAEDAGKGREYVAEVYRARWEEGGDISNPDTIAGIADSLGLDAGTVATAWQDDGFRQRGLATLIRSYQDGLFGVPFFITGREKYFGVDRLRPFVAACRETELDHPVDQAWLADLIEFPELIRPGGDGGHAGGCG